MREARLDGSSVPGLAWDAFGQATLSGELLALAQRLDASFVRWAEEWGAEAVEFPGLVSVETLGRLDYFASFPHLATFPATLPRDEESLARFAAAHPGPGTESVGLEAMEPVRHVLTPAACYALYAHLRGTGAERARYATMKSRCWRREEHYVPLERQWNFTMREIVCIGTDDDVKSFLAAMRERVGGQVAALGLAAEFRHATDPFFRPARNPRHLVQVVEPLKEELVFEGRLAIGSLNHHRGHFGEAFELTVRGEPASSGCVAFGLERWLSAWLHSFGVDPAAWPDPLAGTRGA